MAMFWVKRLRHAEVQQTEHNLLAGIGKLLTRDTAWGWRWITPGIAQTLFQKDNRIGSQSAIYLQLWNSLVWHFCNCRMFPSSRMEEVDTMWKTALWILNLSNKSFIRAKLKVTICCRCKLSFQDIYIYVCIMPVLLWLNPEYCIWILPLAHVVGAFATNPHVAVLQICRRL